MARIDEVTGISNRAALMERVMNRPEASIREMSWAIVMLDVDGFGRVNDILGHAYRHSSWSLLLKILLPASGEMNLLSMSMIFPISTPLKSG